MDSSEIVPNQKSPTKISGRQIAIALVIIVLIAFKFNIFTSARPENTIKNFYHAIEKGDVQKALNYLDNRRLDVPRLAIFLQTVHEQIERKGGVKNIDVVSADGGGEGIYSATVFFNNGEKEVNDIIRIVKDDSGNWKIGQSK